MARSHPAKAITSDKQIEFQSKPQWNAEWWQGWDLQLNHLSG